MEFNYFITGLILGITAGISPGPLMSVLISETIKGNIKNGLIVSIIPILTDIPLIVITLLILKNFKHIDLLIKLLFFLGGLILIYIGVKEIKTKNIEVSNVSSISSLKKGILTNLSNPHPYIFWIFIGIPLILESSVYGIISFVFGFFLGIISVKVIIVFIVEKGKNILKSKYYIFLVKLSGVILIVFGLWFLSKSINILGFNI